MMSMGITPTPGLMANVTNDGGTGTWSDGSKTFTVSLPANTFAASYVTLHVSGCSCVGWEMRVSVSGSWAGGTASAFGSVDGGSGFYTSSPGGTFTFTIYPGATVILQFDNQGSTTRPAMNCTMEVTVSLP